MAKKQITIIPRRIYKYALYTLVGFIFLALFTYIFDIVASKRTSSVITAQKQAIAEARPTSIAVQPSPTPEITDYQTILLLARATDLMVRYVEKVRTGEIDPADGPVRDTYLEAFPVAIEAYNHAAPTAGMEHSWNNVTLVAKAYTLVYPVLQQGGRISDNDLFKMKSSRQWLINYRDTEESVLASRGVGMDFFTTEEQAVEQLLQEDYGGTPVPSSGP